MIKKDLYKIVLFIFGFYILVTIVSAQGKENRNYKIFQFPIDKIPSIDGNKMDWSIVPDSFTIATDQLVDDNKNNQSWKRKLSITSAL